MKKLCGILSVVAMVLLFIHPSLAGPPVNPDNPGVPGLLAEIAQKDQKIAWLTQEIDDLKEQINALQSQGRVPRTGQTTSLATGDDGDLMLALPQSRSPQLFSSLVLV